jgi:hypothetical protein|tara:strand:- start:1313 stop:4033 length:2721 start_codon:yes stop_codon:yes gene_type:complete
MSLPPGGGGGPAPAVEYDRDRYFTPICFRWSYGTGFRAVARVLEPPPGFEEWFFSTQNITEYDCGGQSEGDINIITKRHGFEIPESKQFKFHETKKPKLNQFAFPCQMQRHSDSFFLVHFDDFRALQSVPPSLLTASVSTGRGIRPGERDEKFTDIRWPIGSSNNSRVLKCRHYYALEDVARAFFWPFPYDGSPSLTETEPVHPEPDANDEIRFGPIGSFGGEDGKFKAHVGVMRITDTRYDSNRSELGGSRLVYQEEYNDRHIRKKTLNSIYNFAQKVDPDTQGRTDKPTAEDRADAPEFSSVSKRGLELTVCPNAAAKMTSGQLQDMQAYANGYIGLPRMFLDAHAFYGQRMIVSGSGASLLPNQQQRQFLLGLGDPTVTNRLLQRQPGQSGTDFILEALPHKNAYDDCTSFYASFKGYKRFRNMLDASEGDAGISFKLATRPERVSSRFGRGKAYRIKFKTLLGDVENKDTTDGQIKKWFPSVDKNAYAGMRGIRNDPVWARYIRTRFAYLNYYLKTTRGCNYRYLTRVEKGLALPIGGQGREGMMAPGTGGGPAQVKSPWYRLIHQEVRAGRLPMPEILYLDFSGYSLYGLLGLRPGEEPGDDGRQVFASNPGSNQPFGDPNFDAPSYSVPFSSFDSPQAIQAWESGDESRSAGDIQNLSGIPSRMVAPGFDGSDLPEGISPPFPDLPTVEPPFDPPPEDPVSDPRPPNDPTGDPPPPDDPTVEPPQPPPPPPADNMPAIEHIWVRVHHVSYLEDALPTAVPFVLDVDYFPAVDDGDVYMDASSSLDEQDQRNIALIGFTYDNGFDVIGAASSFNQLTGYPRIIDSGHVIGRKSTLGLNHMYFGNNSVYYQYYYTNMLVYYRRDLGSASFTILNNDFGYSRGFNGWWWWGYNYGNCGCAKPT